MARITLLAVAVALAACAPRSGPPAPVSHGGDSRPALSRAEASSGVVEVKPGDTLYTVARRTGTPVRALIETNRLQAPYRIQAGQRLRIPAVAAAHRTVASPPASTATAAAAPIVAAVPRGSVESAPIAVVPAAAPATSDPAVSAAGPGMVMPPPAAPGSEIAPAGTQPPVAEARAPAAAGQSPTSSAQASASPPAPPVSGAGAPPSAAADETPARAGRFLWPLRGNVVSTFGQKPGGLQNDGINIAAPQGTPVRATENGVVVYAGNELKGFGNLLLLRHADGWMSAYAHLDEISVSRGASVGRGQVIGKVGQTGSVATPQLHFELRRGGRAVDPRGQLAPLQTAAAN